MADLSHLPPVEKFFGTEGLSPEYGKLRDYILQKLMGEHPSVDTLDLMLLERVAYIYARIRQREAAGAFGNERIYRSASLLLSTYMGEVRKSDDRQQLLDLIRADAVEVVVSSLKEAVGELSPDQQKKVMSNVLKLVHSNEDGPEQQAL